MVRKGEKLICPKDNRLGTSYVDALADGDAGLCNYMLSYSWGYPVGDIADTLSDFFGEESLHEFIWICCLCINQHRATWLICISLTCPLIATVTMPCSLVNPVASYSISTKQKTIQRPPKRQAQQPLAAKPWLAAKFCGHLVRV